MIEINIYDFGEVISDNDVMFTISIKGEAMSSLYGKVKTIPRYDPKTSKVTGNRNIMSVKTLIEWLKSNALDV